MIKYDSKYTLFLKYCFNYHIFVRWRTVCFKKSLCTPRLHLFEEKYSKTVILRIYLNICMLCINVIYSCDGIAEFSAAISPVFSVTRSLRNHSNMLIWCLKKTFLIIINVENSCAGSYFLFSGFFYEYTVNLERTACI